MTKTACSMLLLAVGLLNSFAATPADAQSYQSCGGRADFDQCMAAVTNRNIRQNQVAQQQNFQNYLNTNQQWLRQNYAAHRANGGQMSFLQFAQWGLMTANGTNYAGARQAQIDRFNGTQNANRTVQGGYQDYNAGMYNNSRRMGEAATRYDQGAIRGNAQYGSPNGQGTWLPYGRQSNQPFTQGGNTYVQTPNGNYYQQQGNSWVQMSPR